MFYFQQSVINLVFYFAQISANICDITIDVKDSHDQKLLQVVMIHPKVCDLQNNTYSVIDNSI